MLRRKNVDKEIHYPSDNWSYGVELEYGNVDRRIELPDDAQWNFLDNTCVSSTGIANDPRGEIYYFGGEINTRPTNTIDEQINHIAEINKAVNPAINYRSNLHIHIHVPGLKDDLHGLKNLLNYVNACGKDAMELVEPIPIPVRKNKTEDEYKWEMKRYKRRLKSHQHRLSETQVERMMSATNTKDFFENEAHKDAKGNPAWFQCPRAGINIRQIYEHSETLEFRHFPGTINMYEMIDAITWCKLFLDAALNNHAVSPVDIYNHRKWQFPKFAKYDYYAEQVYQYTNFDKNNRKTVEQRLKHLRKEVDIDDMNTPSKDVYDAMNKIEGIEIEQVATLPL